MERFKNSLTKKLGIAMKKTNKMDKMSEKSATFYKGTHRKKERGISRIDSRDTHGWFVRVYNESVTYSKLFSDKKWRGEDNAFEAAVAFRNELYAEVGKAFPTRRVVRTDKRNKTGVIGICRTRKRNASGSYNEFFSVSWSPEYGSHKCRMFSVSKYGEREAFRRACELRREVEIEIHGHSWLEIPKEVPPYQGTIGNDAPKKPKTPSEEEM